MSASERLVDAVVVEHGTLPADGLVLELQPMSRNNGGVGLAALLSVPAKSQPGLLDRSVGDSKDKAAGDDVDDGGKGSALYRVGDAVASRNVHAAIFDSLRLCKGF